jgi:FdhD protein
MKVPSESIDYYQYGRQKFERINGEVIVEMPVSLTVNAQVWLTFMCTPVDLEEMAIGFLYNEGVIQSMDEIADYRLCASGDNVDIWLTHQVEKPKKWRRTSGCTGGITSVEEQFDSFPDQPIKVNGTSLRPEQIGDLVELLFSAQDLYRTSGGVHTSALSDGKSIIVAAEDIGRHNTLDKISGKLLLNPSPIKRRVILSTGRISSEMLQKSARLKASVVISRTSPSSLSIRLAEQYGITLIGYARRNQFNLYTHPERILEKAGGSIKHATYHAS